MARIAVPLVVAFIALLVFLGWMINTRRVRQRDLVAAQRESLTDYSVLVDEVHRVARQSLDIDPSAALIDHTITAFKQRRELP